MSAPTWLWALSYDVNSKLQLLYNKGVENTRRNHVRLLRYTPYFFLNTYCYIKKDLQTILNFPRD